MMHLPIYFRWLGVAGIELSTEDQVLAIDPYITRIPFFKNYIGRVQPNLSLAEKMLPRCDEILISHCHIDHMLDVPVIANRTGAVVYGSPNTCRLASILGVAERQIRPIQVGDHLDLGVFQVEMSLTRHRLLPGFTPGHLRENLRPPLRARDYRMDDCFNFYIQSSGLRFMLAEGDLVEPLHPAEILFIGPLYTEAFFRQALARVRPQIVIPIHWDDFWQPLSKPVRGSLVPPGKILPAFRRVDLRQFALQIERLSPGTRVFIPETMTRYSLQEILRENIHIHHDNR